MKRSYWFGFALCACLVLGAGCAAASAQGMESSLQHDEAVARLVGACNYPATMRNGARNLIARLKTPVNEDDAKFQMLERRIASASPEQLAPSIASAFRGHISTQDADTVADMFESAAGRKIIAVSLQTFMQSGTDISALVQRVGLTDTEKETFSQFVRTPAWLHYRQLATDPQVASALMLNIIRSDLFTPEERKGFLGPNG